jgi:hypothetical protein
MSKKIWMKVEMMSIIRLIMLRTLRRDQHFNPDKQKNFKGLNQDYLVKGLLVVDK